MAMKRTQPEVSGRLTSFLALLLLPRAVAQSFDIGPPCVERAIEEFGKDGPCNANELACHCEIPNQSSLASDMNVACASAHDSAAQQSVTAYVQSYCHIILGTGGEEASTGSSSPVTVSTTMPGTTQPTSTQPTSSASSPSATPVTSPHIPIPISTTITSSTSPSVSQASSASQTMSMTQASSNSSAMQTSPAVSATTSSTSGGKQIRDTDKMAVVFAAGIGSALFLGMLL